MKTLTTLAACVVVLAATSVASATIIIDNFNSGDQSLSVRQAAPNSSSLVWGLLEADVLGGTREVLLPWIGGASRTFADVNLDDNGTLDYAQGPGTESRLTIIWEREQSPDQIGLSDYNLGVDLTAQGDTGFVANLLNIDLPIKFRIEVYTDASNASYWETVGAGGDTGAKYVPFAAFSTLSGGGADFTNVGAIKLVIDGTGYPDTDVSIDYFATGVPEPSTLALAGVALFGAVFMARRRRWRS